MDGTPSSLGTVCAESNSFDKMPIGREPITEYRKRASCRSADRKEWQLQAIMVATAVSSLSCLRVEHAGVGCIVWFWVSRLSARSACFSLRARDQNHRKDDEEAYRFGIVIVVSPIQNLNSRERLHSSSFTVRVENNWQ